MMRFMQLLAPVVLTIGVALFGAPSAQAQTINCEAHTLDVTSRQGIDFAYVSRAVDRLKERVPNADVYIQAYEQMPGGSADAFWQLAQQQCGNWRDVSNTRVKDNVFVIVYGHDIDAVGVHYGQDLGMATPVHGEGMANAIASNLGPGKSQADPNYISQALVQPVMDIRFYVGLSNYFHKADGIYYPPIYTEVGGDNAFHPAVVGGLILGVIAFFILVGLVFRGLARLFWPAKQ